MMNDQVFALRARCLDVIAADEHQRARGGGGLHPDFARLARVLFALTASRDAAVMDAIDKAIGIADGTEP